MHQIKKVCNLRFRKKLPLCVKPSHINRFSKNVFISVEKRTTTIIFFKYLILYSILYFSNNSREKPRVLNLCANY